MKFQVEIPDEDIKKLEKLMGSTKILIAERWEDGLFRQYFQEFFTMLAKVIVNKLYEGLLAMESGVMTPEEFVERMTGEGVRIAIEAEIRTALEAEKRSKDKTS